MREKPIEAEYIDREYHWEIKSKFGSITADELVLSVGWGDPSSKQLEHARHAAIAIAHQLDGTYVVVHECFSQAVGDLRDLSRQLIDAKDLLKIKTCFLDKTLVEFYDYLRRVDGFTSYRVLGEDEVGNVSYAQDPATWTYFAGWHRTCDIRGVSEEMILRFESYQAEVQYMIGTRKLVTGMRTPELMVALAMPPGRWKENPFCKALVYGISMLERDLSGRQEDSVITQDIWYRQR